MSIIHMDTDIVDDQSRRMTYTATDMLEYLDRLRYSARDLRQGWTGSKASGFCEGLDKLIESLRSHAMELDSLGKNVIREVDQWINVDRTGSTYLSDLKKEFTLSWENIKGWKDDSLKIGSAIALAGSLRWSPLRPNSIIFTGPNWLRKMLDIKEMTRVIRPETLAKDMALVGLVVSATDAFGAIIHDLSDARYEDASRTVSAAAVDGAFRFAISAAGTVVIPLALGALVAAVGVVGVPAGAAVLIGSVLGGIAYSKMLETPAWDWWKQSNVRNEIIEGGTRTINLIDNYVRDIGRKATERINGAFENSIRSVTLNASLVPSSGKHHVFFHFNGIHLVRRRIFHGFVSD